MRMPHFPTPNWHSDFKYDLTNITKILEKLGNPHLRMPPTIHIAGTNGKGSSCAMLRSIFEAAGYKVHVYTSPHLLEFNERIVLAGEKISDPYLFEICEKTRLASMDANIQPAFFEGTTAAAFLAFANIQADILILETGMGGRFDPTNVIPNPLITLITPISYDHMEHLGTTLPLIASQKAGIIKPHVPSVISCQVDEVYETLLTECETLFAPAFCYEYDFGLKKTQNGFIYLSQKFSYEFPTPALPGDHQLVNASSVIALISLISQKFNISNENIMMGLKKTIWPARIQKIDKDRCMRLVGGNRQIWVDGAHNNSGAQVLSNWIEDNLEPPVYLILGMTKNRNVEDFCSYFSKLITKGYGVRVLSELYSYSADQLSQKASITGIEFESAPTLEDALQLIKALNDKKANIVIAGSLFLASDFFKLES